MVKRILIALGVFLIFIHITGEGNAILPDPVNPEDFVSEVEAHAVSGFIAMTKPSQDYLPPDDGDDERSSCECKGGKLSYDGGTSWVDCPCVNDPENGCGCIHSRGSLSRTTVCNGEDCKENCACDDETMCICESCECANCPDRQVVSTTQLWSIEKVTADWCEPCKRWNREVRPQIEAAGFSVGEIDGPASSEFCRVMGINTYPTFLFRNTQTGKLSSRKLVGYKTESQIREFVSGLPQ